MLGDAWLSKSTSPVSLKIALALHQDRSSSVGIDAIEAKHNALRSSQDQIRSDHTNLPLCRNSFYQENIPTIYWILDAL